MSAALDGVDRVGEGVDAFRVRLVPLHGHLNREAAIGLLGGEVDDGLVQRTLGCVQVPDEVRDASRVVVGDLPGSTTAGGGSGGD